MKFCKILSLTLMVLAAVSCSTPKEISYFQDLRPGVTELTITDSVEIKVRPKDKLSILVNAQDPKLTNMFNLPIVSQQIGQESTGSSGTIRGVSGYTVDSFGDINFPVLGKIRVEGMTREQIADYLTKQLKEQELIKDPVVTVEFMNLGVSVLGEVNKPGRISINRDNMTILDALSEAGDLTIFGKREKVLVLRQEDGKQRVYGVNLCSADHIYTSPVYYLQQNDVVYVIPNNTKSRQSTVNGNTVRSTSFWISLASLITSIAVLIAKSLQDGNHSKENPSPEYAGFHPYSGPSLYVPRQVALVCTFIGSLPRSGNSLSPSHAARLYPFGIHPYQGRLQGQVRLYRHGILCRFRHLHHQHQCQQRDGNSQVARPDA